MFVAVCSSFQFMSDCNGDAWRKMQHIQKDRNSGKSSKIKLKMAAKWALFGASCRRLSFVFLVLLFFFSFFVLCDDKLSRCYTEMRRKENMYEKLCRCVYLRLYVGHRLPYPCSLWYFIVMRNAICFIHIPMQIRAIATADFMNAREMLIQSINPNATFKRAHCSVSIYKGQIKWQK